LLCPVLLLRSRSADLPPLHSFPTRRSSDLLLPVLLGEPDEVGVMELVVVAQMRVRSLRTEVDRVNAALKVALHADVVTQRDPGRLVRNLDRVVAAEDPVGPGSSGQGSCKLLALDVVSLIEQEEVSATLEGGGELLALLFVLKDQRRGRHPVTVVDDADAVS